MLKVHRIHDTKKQQAPLVSWIPVKGADGRIHMEMRWHVGETPVSRRTPHAAA